MIRLHFAPFLRFLLLAACWSSFPAYGQQATLRGFVRDANDDQPLQGATIVLRRGAELAAGTATDTDGLYTLRAPAGSYVLSATFVGYRPFTDTLDLARGEIRTLNFRLQPDDEELNEVVVEAESETAGAAAVTAGLQTIRPKDMEMIPSPDVSADLAGYLVTLPGVVATGDQGGQFFIRGGEPTQNLVLVDGMPLFQPFHLLGFYSAFPSDIVQNADVYAGGYPARFGGMLSSVIDISTRTGNKRRFAGSASVAPFVSGALVEGPIIGRRVSMLASYRKSMIEQGASKLIEKPLPYDFYDGFAKVHADLSTSSQASVTAIRTRDQSLLGVEGGAASDIDEVTWENMAVGARYILLPARMPVLAELLISTSRTENSFGPEASPTRRSSAQQINSTLNMTHFMSGADVSWGLFVGTGIYESELGGLFQDLQTEQEYVTEAGFYLAPEFRLGTLRLTPGIRIHAFPSKGNTFVEPRIRAVLETDMGRFSGAWGLYHQEIVGLNDRRDAGDVFTAWSTSPLERVPGAMHMLTGYAARPAPWLNVSIEAFFKTMQDLSIAEWSAFPQFTTRLQPADGRAHGMDARLEARRGPLSGFVSYGYASVEYEAKAEKLQYWFGTLRKSFQPSHDRRHQVNAVGAVDVAGFNLSLRWQFGSGLPYSQALGFDTYVLLPGPTDVLQEPGSRRVLYGEPYRARLPAYHRLDVSLERTVHFGRHASATVQGSLINAYDRPNLFYLDLYTLRRVDQLPLIPSFGIKVSFE